MQRYLLLEVNEGGRVSSLVNGGVGFLWMVGPIPEELKQTPPIEIQEVREFMRSIRELNLRIWPEWRRNIKPLGVVIMSIDGEPDDATPLEEMKTASKEHLQKIELYYRAPLGELS